MDGTTPVEVEKYRGPNADLYNQAAEEVMKRTHGDLVVNGGDFMSVDGTIFINTERSTEYEEARTLEQGLGGDRTRKMETVIAPHNGQLPLEGGAYRHELVGKYGSNNGLIQYVDVSGKMHAGVATRENDKALRDAGYERSSNFPVSLSTSVSKFVSTSIFLATKEDRTQAVEDLNTRYQEMLERGIKKLEQENEKQASPV